VAKLTTETAAPQPTPQRLGRYRIDDVLGQGALGTVYRAFDPHGQRMVAVKALRPGIAGGPIGLRVLEQARAAARLAHPGIVAVHEVDDDRRQPFIVTEYVAGMNLAQWQAATPLPAQSLILQVMDQLLEALELAHRAGLRHGSLKPTNVLVTSTGLIKLSDFGIARLEDGTLMPGLRPELLAPEVALGRPIDIGVDIYAAGALLYRLLTGRDPAVGTADVALPAATIGGARAPSSYADARRPAAFDAIVARAMAREPGDRYPSAEAFREALGVRFGHARTVHGAGSVELAKTVSMAPAAPPRPAMTPRVAAFAAKAAKAAKAALAGMAPKGAPEAAAEAPVAPARPAAPSKPAVEVPTLTIAIPDDVLSMPAYDPWTDSSYDAEAAPARRQRAPVEADEPEGDPDTVSGILAMDEEAYRAFVDQVELEKQEQYAAAADAARAADAAEAAARARRAAAARPVAPAAPQAVAAPVPARVEPARLEPAPSAGTAPDALADGPGIPMEALRRALKIMTPHFGAGAGTVLKQVALQARSVDELHEMILDRAGETIDRRKMRKQLKAMAKIPL
jgi:serine/threonine-protein kinase